MIAQREVKVDSVALLCNDAGRLENLVGVISGVIAHGDYNLFGSNQTSQCKGEQKTTVHCETAYDGGCHFSRGKITLFSIQEAEVSRTQIGSRKASQEYDTVRRGSIVEPRMKTCDWQSGIESMRILLVPYK